MVINQENKQLLVSSGLAVSALALFAVFSPSVTLHREVSSNMQSAASIQAPYIQPTRTPINITSASSFPVNGTSPRVLKTDTTGDQKVLVLLLNFLDSGVAPFTKNQAYDMMFNGQTQKYFKEQSYGNISFSGDVIGWNTVQKNAPVNVPGQGVDCTGSIGPSDYGPIISNNNIDLTKYDQLVLVMNGHFMTGCDVSIGKTNITVNNVSYHLGLIYIAVDSSYSQTNGGVYNGDTLPPAFSWTVFDDVLSHELGHALGLLHANGLDCGDNTFATNCQSYEYGNPFDLMGMAVGGALHFNAFYKERLGWIATSSEIVITQSGRYTINPLETTGGIKLAKIKLADGRTPFYLEYRRAVGFDSRLAEPVVASNQNGLLINAVNIAVNGGVTYTNKSLLLDMTPGPTSSFGYWISSSIDSSLKGSNTFTVSDYGLTIGPIISNDANSITFDVRLNNVARVGQITSPTSGSTYNVGDTVNFVAQISGVGATWNCTWSFDDGATSNTSGDSCKNQSHIYVKSGKYAVNLSVFDSSHNQISSTPILLAIGQVTPLSVTANPPSVASGKTVTLNFGIPNNVVATKLFLSCPSDTSGIWSGNIGGGQQLCNKWTTFNSPTISSITIQVTNSTSQVKNLVPNFYVYYANNPNYAVGVSSQITVLAGSPVNPPSKPSPVPIRSSVNY